MKNKLFKNEKIINIINVLGIGIFISIATVFLLQLFHYEYDFERTIEFFDYQTRLNLLQAIIVFFVYLWFFFLTGSIGFASIILLVFSFIIGITTQQKNFFRGEPVYPSDVYFLKDFRLLFEMVDSGTVIRIIAVLLLMIGSVVFFLKRKKKESITRSDLLQRSIGFILTTMILFYVYQFNEPGNKVRAVFDRRVEWVSFSQERNYSNNGVVSGLMYNLKSTAVEKPNDYSKEKIAEIHNKYSQEAEKTNIARTGSLEDYNLIFVMSETFSDPTRIEGMTISGDPIPLYREWSKNYTHGQILSQGYGGGTANIEFEALTGISLEPLSSNITTPFIQLNTKMKGFPSIVGLMSDAGHELTAIHPYNTKMYKRLENYASLGFHETIFQDDMENPVRIDDNKFISDASAYEEVWKVLERTEEKDFIHLVTMQNHQPHVHNYEEVDFEVKGAPYNLKVAHYAQGIQYSDRVLDELLQELDEFDEKTILVFWGDHLPGFHGDELMELNGPVVMHETPLMFYTNFSKDSRDIGTISPIYFMSYIMELANAPISPYIALLEKLEEVLPAFEKGTYLERGSSLKESREELAPETIEILNDYDTILYDVTTGKNFGQNLNFYRIIQRRGP